METALVCAVLSGLFVLSDVEQSEAQSPTLTIERIVDPANTEIDSTRKAGIDAASLLHDAETMISNQSLLVREPVWIEMDLDGDGVARISGEGNYNFQMVQDRKLGFFSFDSGLMSLKLSLKKLSGWGAIYGGKRAIGGGTELMFVAGGAQGENTVFLKKGCLSIESVAKSGVPVVGQQVAGELDCAGMAEYSPTDSLGQNLTVKSSKELAFTWNRDGVLAPVTGASLLTLANMFQYHNHTVWPHWYQNTAVMAGIAAGVLALGTGIYLATKPKTATGEVVITFP